MPTLYDYLITSFITTNKWGGKAKQRERESTESSIGWSEPLFCARGGTRRHSSDCTEHIFGKNAILAVYETNK